MTASSQSRKTTWGYRLWVLHRWLGLGAGLILLCIGFSGALLLLDDELKSTVESTHHVINAPATPDAEPTPLNPSLAELERRHPGLAVSVVYWPEEHDRAVEVVLRNADRSQMRLATLNPWTGEILSSVPRIDTVHYWALQLHSRLFLGKTGMILTTFGAVSLTLLALTGLWLNRHVFRTLARAPMRLGRGARLAWSDLHKWSGSASLVFIFILGVTGLIYMILLLPGEFRSHAGHQHGAPRDTRIDWAQLPEISVLRAKAKSALPGHEFHQLVIPGGRSPAFSANLLDRDAWWWNKRATASFDARSGQLLKALTGPERTTKDRALSALSAFHFGTQGAPWVKWLYLFLGAIAPGLLSVTGFAIWFIRRRKRTARLSTTAAHT